MSSWQKWRRLSRLEQRFLLQACLLLPVVVVLLRLGGLRRCQGCLNWFNKPSQGEARVLSPAQLLVLARAGVLVRVAARRGAVRATCLPQALVLWRLLARWGIPTNLQIGVRKDAGDLGAHAWVEYQGRVLNDTADVRERYLPFAASFDPIC